MFPRDVEIGTEKRLICFVADNVNRVFKTRRLKLRKIRYYDGMGSSIEIMLIGIAFVANVSEHICISFYKHFRTNKQVSVE